MHTGRFSQQQSARSSGQSGFLPVQNETPNKDSSQVTAPHDEHDWMAFGLSLSGDVDDDQSNSQADISKEHSTQPPELKRHVASSWGDRNGVIVTAWAEITKQNPLTGPSIYHEHYSSEEEDLAWGLGKVATKSQCPGSTYNDGGVDTMSPVSFSTREAPEISSTANSTSAHTATTAVSAATSTRLFTAAPQGRPFHLHSTTKRSNRVVVEEQLFEAIKEAIIVKQEEDEIIESIKDMSTQDDEEEDYDDEMEFVQVNNATNEFEIPQDCSLMQLASITPSPDVMRMQTSPRETPPVKDFDMMHLSPKNTPSSVDKHVFQTVFQASPNGLVQPTQLKAAASSTFSYPPPIFSGGKAGNASRAGTSTQHARVSDRKASPTIKHLFQMPSTNSNRDGGVAKGPGGIFKAMASKRKDSRAAEYTMGFSGEKPATTASTVVEPYEELYRATSPTIEHPLFLPISPGRHSSAFAPGVSIDRRSHPQQQAANSTKKKHPAKKNAITENSTKHYFAT